MGLLGKLKDLFGGSGSGGQGGDTGLYLYVRLDRTGEVVRLRLEPQYELVPDYDEGGYFTRKSVVGPLTFARAEATFRFDEGRRLASWDITGGQLADQADWEAQQQPQDAA